MWVTQFEEAIRPEMFGSSVVPNAGEGNWDDNLVVKSTSIQIIIKGRMNFTIFIILQTMKC